MYATPSSLTAREHANSAAMIERVGMGAVGRLRAEG